MRLRCVADIDGEDDDDDDDDDLDGEEDESEVGLSYLQKSGLEVDQICWTNCSCCWTEVVCFSL